MVYIYSIFCRFASRPMNVELCVVSTMLWCSCSSPLCMTTLETGELHHASLATGAVLKSSGVFICVSVEMRLSKSPDCEISTSHLDSSICIELSFLSPQQNAQNLRQQRVRLRAACAKQGC